MGQTHRATQTTTFTGFGGVQLAGERFDGGGTDSGAGTVLLLHGGGQTRHSWRRTAQALAQAGWTAWTLDTRGHGESQWAPEGDYRLSSLAGDVQEVIDRVGEPPVIVGASLGGLTAIHLLGVTAPEAARGLVLVDIVPQMNEAGADRISAFMNEHIDRGFATLEEAADAVAAYNQHRTRPPDPQGLKKNLRQGEDGRWYWHWDPAFVRGGVKGDGIGVMNTEALMDACRNIVVPRMLVRGRLSDLVDAEAAAQFIREVPGTEFADVSQAGHMVAGDHNDAFLSTVVGFLESLR